MFVDISYWIIAMIMAVLVVYFAYKASIKKILLSLFGGAALYAAIHIVSKLL
jgi:lipopolysaccharide export LptBFGC system permease protein LptF